MKAMFLSARRALALAVWLPLVACSERPPDEFLLGGIQVNEPDMVHWHRSLISAGFNTVSLTVYARQRAWDSSDIVFDPDQLSGDVVREIRAAKRMGLRVVLILRVALEHALIENRFLWHGLIQPHTESDLDAWFYRYGEFVTNWAEIAEREGVDLFGIGSELSSLTATRPLEEIPGLERYYLDLEKRELERARTLADPLAAAAQDLRGSWGETFESPERFLDEQALAQAAWARQVTFDGDVEQMNGRRVRLEQNWRRLIAAVRALYSGQITYAANFDQYQEVGFWDALDVIGVNGYFPLRQRKQAGDSAGFAEQFRSAWQQHLAGIDEVRRTQNPEAKIVFTELGYTRKRGTTIQPWAADGVALLGDPSGSNSEVLVWGQQPEDRQERVAAIRGLSQALEEWPDLLGGLLYWKLSTVAQHEQIEPFVLILDRRPPDPLEAALLELGLGASARSAGDQ